MSIKIKQNSSNSSPNIKIFQPKSGVLIKPHSYYCCQGVTHQSANYFRVSTTIFVLPCHKKPTLLKNCPPRVLRWFVNYRFEIRNRSTLRSCASQWYRQGEADRQTDRGGSIIIIIIWDCLEGSAQSIIAERDSGLSDSRWIAHNKGFFGDFFKKGSENGLVLKNCTVRVADRGHNSLKYNLMGCALWKTIKCKIPLVSDTLLKHHQLQCEFSPFRQQFNPVFGNSVNLRGKGWFLAHFDFKCCDNIPPFPKLL